MPKVIVSIDGVVIKEVQLTKDRTTIGRRPYNDIVIDNLAVSGEHAALQTSGAEVYLEDQNSTNGSYINGKAVKKQLLQNDDVIEIGKYRIKFLADATFGYEKTIVSKAGASPAVQAPASAASTVPMAMPTEKAGNAAIKVLSGAATGREVDLVKVVTTIGKPGIAIAAITKRPSGYVIAHVEGTSKTAVNGLVIGAEATSLRNGDVIELAGTQMQFVLK